MAFMPVPKETLSNCIAPENAYSPDLFHGIWNRNINKARAIAERMSRDRLKPFGQSHFFKARRIGKSIFGNLRHTVGYVRFLQGKTTLKRIGSDTCQTVGKSDLLQIPAI